MANDFSAEVLLRGIGLDRYEIGARLRPALLTLAPVFLVVAVWVPQARSMVGVVVGLATTLGLTYFLAQLARRLGRRLERRLGDRVGRLHSARLLTFADETLALESKLRHHAFLRSNGIVTSAPEEERAAPARRVRPRPFRGRLAARVHEAARQEVAAVRRQRRLRVHAQPACVEASRARDRRPRDDRRRESRGVPSPRACARSYRGFGRWCGIGRRPPRVAVHRDGGCGRGGFPRLCAAALQPVRDGRDPILRDRAAPRSRSKDSTTGMPVRSLAASPQERALVELRDASASTRGHRSHARWAAFMPPSTPATIRRGPHAATPRPSSTRSRRRI